MSFNATDFICSSCTLLLLDLHRTILLCKRPLTISAPKQVLLVCLPKTFFEAPTKRAGDLLPPFDIFLHLRCFSPALGLESELSGDNETLNFRSAFANFAKLCVSEETLCREILDIAVSAVNLHAEVAALAGNF